MQSFSEHIKKITTSQIFIQGIALGRGAGRCNSYSFRETGGCPYQYTFSTTRLLKVRGRDRMLYTITALLPIADKKDVGNDDG
jgi:hypothetical protein